MKRYYGIDLLRGLGFISIVVFHFHYFVFYEDTFTPSVLFPVFWKPLEVLARSLSFSGHIIIFLSSVLYGMRDASKSPKKILWFTGIGALIFNALSFFAGSAFFYWDIYHLLFVGFAVGLVLLRWVPNGKTLLMISGFGILCTTPWRWDWLHSAYPLLTSALIGDCESRAADWPLFPWVGLIFLGLGLGRWISRRNPGHTIGKKEAVGWSIVLGASVPFLGIYYPHPVGDGFVCFNLRQEPYVFLSHMVWIGFFLRLSLLEKVNALLRSNSLIHWFSSLKISTHFGFVYLIQYILVYLFGELAQQPLKENPSLYAASFIFILAGSEFGARLAIRLPTYFRPNSPEKK